MPEAVKPGNSTKSNGQSAMLPVNYGFHEQTEVDMFELLKSLLMAIIMVPLVMAIMLGLIYGLGEIFNLISGSRRNNEQAAHHQTRQ